MKVDFGRLGSHHEHHVWLDLGNKSTMAKVRQRPWFQINVNKVTRHLLCFKSLLIRFKEDHNLSLTLIKSLKMTIKCFYHALLAMSRYCMKMDEIHCKRAIGLRLSKHIYVIYEYIRATLCNF